MLLQNTNSYHSHFLAARMKLDNGDFESSVFHYDIALSMHRTEDISIETVAPHFFLGNFTLAKSRYLALLSTCSEKTEDAIRFNLGLVLYELKEYASLNKLIDDFSLEFKNDRIDEYSVAFLCFLAGREKTGVKLLKDHLFCHKDCP